MSKGSIVLVPFPFTDLTGQKVRPALVLYVSPKGEDCVVVFVSSKQVARMRVFDTPAKPSVQNGLKTDSVIKADKIATLQKKIILGELGVLERSLLSLVDGKLKKLFQL